MRTLSLPGSRAGRAVAQPAAAVVELVGVGKRYAGVQALRDVSLSVAPGEVVGLIGPNGSGKTTLLNVASGVARPTAGSVRIAGTPCGGRAAHDFADLGVGRTFQQIRLFRELSVLDNVRLGALASRRAARDDAHAVELVERLGLATVRDQAAGTLSYGQQRRAEIARALAGRPGVLLLDEPAAGMNEAESDELLATVRALHADLGVAVLIVDHDLRLIMRLCQRIVVLAAGAAIADGSPEEVRRDPAVVQAYLGSAARTSADT